MRCLLGPSTNLGRAFQSASARALSGSNINAAFFSRNAVQGGWGRGHQQVQGMKSMDFTMGSNGFYIPDIPGMLEILKVWKMDEHGLFLELLLDSQKKNVVTCRGDDTLDADGYLAAGNSTYF